jgi:hypothetical protein
VGPASRMACGTESWASNGRVISLHLFPRDMFDKHSQIYVFGVDSVAVSVSMNAICLLFGFAGCCQSRMVALRARNQGRFS